MADFWLGAVVGGCAVAVLSVWACFYFHRRNLEATEAAKIHLNAVRRAQYESDVHWRRREADWDDFAGQVLSAATQPHLTHLLTMLPTHSALRRPEVEDPAQESTAPSTIVAPSTTEETEEMVRTVPRTAA